MKTFPAAYSTELAKKTGLTPVWILKLTAGASVYYLSDTAYTFAAGSATWTGTTTPWIASWGQIREAVSGSIGEILVADLSVDVLVDQDTTPNIRTLALTTELETSPVELYLWLDGLDIASVTPQLIYRGYVKDVDIPDETMVRLSIEDETSRLKGYVGTKVTTTEFPHADDADVGRVIPIVYGAVSKVPAIRADVPIRTTLTAAVTSIQQTTITVSDATGIAADMLLRIDSEAMLVSSVSGSTITVQRGKDGTSAAVHDSGSAVVEYFITTITTSALTTLYAAATAAATTLTVVSSASMSTGSYLQIDSEQMLITGTTTVWADSTVTVDSTTFDAVTTALIVTNAGLLVDGQKIKIDSEIMLVVSHVNSWWVTVTRAQDGTTAAAHARYAAIYSPKPGVTVTRGQRSTTAAAHSAGATVNKLILPSNSNCIFIAAAHPVAAISKVWAKVAEQFHDITALCTRNLSSGWTGKDWATVTMPNSISIQQLTALQMSGLVEAIDSLHSHNTTPSSTTITQSPTTAVPQTNGAIATTASNPTSYFVAASVTFPNPGTITACSSLGVTITWSAGWNGSTYPVKVVVTGNGTYTHWSGTASSGTSVAISGPITNAGAMNCHTVQLWVANDSSYNMSISGTISAASRSITYTPSGTSVSSGPANISINNTLALTGSQIAATIFETGIYCDLSRSITAPEAVVGNILSTWCNDSTLQLVGSFPAGYAFNGAITEYKTALEWIDRLAFQCRAWFRKIGGTSKLIVRAATPSSPTTIAACALTDEGIKDLSFKKAPVSDVINTINLLYDRDWSSSATADLVFKATSSGSDATSISAYGTLEQPDVFRFEFVTSSTMAADLVTFYLALFSTRRWLITFRAFLDRLAVEFGDPVSLTFADNRSGFVIESGVSPANANTIDSISYTVRS